MLYLGLATLPPLPIALVVLAVAGLAAGPINPLIFTVLTEVVPKDLRGRIFGAVRAGAWASIPLGVLLGGVIVGTSGSPRRFSRSACSLARRRLRVLQPGVSRDGSRRGDVMNARAVVLVEGISDQRAVATLAQRRGRDLEAEGVSILPIGGAHAIGTISSGSGPEGWT